MLKSTEDVFAVLIHPSYTLPAQVRVFILIEAIILLPSLSGIEVVV
jgi:hypothetical protein